MYITKRLTGRKPQLALHDKVEDYNDKLVSDSAYSLNCTAEKMVFCFTKEQADAILKRCRVKCRIIEIENQYAVQKL